jgi:pyruvate dehydrogenase E2 component (dihydrolipoamide acetyltransferase)
MPDVVMPRLSDSMEEGTIIKWLKSDGDAVARGEELVEIETDKATMTYEADTDGALEIVAGEGDTLPIGEVIARIGDGGSESGDPAAAESAESTQAEAAIEAPAAEVPPPEPRRAEARAEGGAGDDGGGRVKASPVARRMARKMGIELRSVTGTGPGGRVIKADVEAAEQGGGAAAAPAKAAEAPAASKPAAAAPIAAPPAAPAPPPPPAGKVTETGTAKGDVEIVELSRTQQLIARRMAESKATVPEFVLNMDVDMEECFRGRAALKVAAREGDVVPSFNDMVVKAVALALREFPRANGAYKDAKWELYSRVNVGIAVAAAGSLVVPTIFDADRKGLREIASDARLLAGKVRDGTVTPPELSGGTFTVSNLGMYGISSFQAVINPPQAGILAVGALEPRLVPGAGGGPPETRHRMTVTLACDHRILYGADGAEFLGRIRDLLQSPLALAL